MQDKKASSFTVLQLSTHKTISGEICFTKDHQDIANNIYYSGIPLITEMIKAKKRGVNNFSVGKYEYTIQQLEHPDLHIKEIEPVVNNSMQSSDYEIERTDRRAWWSFMEEYHSRNYKFAKRYYGSDFKELSKNGTLTINNAFQYHGLPTISALDGRIKLNGIEVAAYDEEGYVILLK